MFSSLHQCKKQRSGRATKYHEDLLKLFEKDSRCHHCGCQTTMNRFDEWGTHKRDAATIDHLFSNLDIRRLLKGARSMFILSCYWCNIKRGTRENKAVYHNDYDKRRNKVSIIDILLTNRFPNLLN